MSLKISWPNIIAAISNTVILLILITLALSGEVFLLTEWQTMALKILRHANSWTTVIAFKFKEPCPASQCIFPKLLRFAGFSQEDYTSIFYCWVRFENNYLLWRVISTISLNLKLKTLYSIYFSTLFFQN